MGSDFKDPIELMLRRELDVVETSCSLIPFFQLFETMASLARTSTWWCFVRTALPTLTLIFAFVFECDA